MLSIYRYARWRDPGSIRSRHTSERPPSCGPQFAVVRLRGASDIHPQNHPHSSTLDATANRWQEQAKRRGNYRAPYPYPRRHAHAIPRGSAARLLALGYPWSNGRIQYLDSRRREHGWTFPVVQLCQLDRQPGHALSAQDQYAASKTDGERDQRERSNGKLGGAATDGHVHQWARAVDAVWQRDDHDLLERRTRVDAHGIPTGFAREYDGERQ